MDTYEGETGDPASLHKYLYTCASPVNSSDPSGNMTLVENQITVFGIGISIKTAAAAGVVLAAVQYPFRNWTIRIGMRADPFHTFLTVASKDGRYYKYDISLRPRDIVLAKQNKFQTFDSFLVVKKLNSAADAEAGTLAVAKLSNLIFPIWNKYVTGSGSPGEDTIGPLPYVYAYRNCLTYSAWWASFASTLSLIPF